ncbi:MAG: DOPA 4,5-dioxygenase family protein [Bacteriovoracaceae bacterium]
MNYHGHVYYDEKSEQSALKLFEELGKLNLPTLKKLPSVGIPTGPHPLPMFEIHFAQDDFPFIHTWFKYRRGTLSVLLHENTNEDQKNHTDGALWLGEKVQIDFGYFKN